MNLEGLVKYLKENYPQGWGRCTVPYVVTKENVNQSCGLGYEDGTLLELAVRKNLANTMLITQLIELGANVTPNCLLSENWKYFLLEMVGTGINKIIQPQLRILDLIVLYGSVKDGGLLIDYGAKISGSYSYYCRYRFDQVVEKRALLLQQYEHLSNRRVDECRKSLLAILFACTKGASGNISPFRPVVEILLSAARQTWAMRGGEGIGPRGWLWKAIL